MPVPNDDERTVHNSLYKRQEIPVVSTAATTATTRLQSSSPTGPHVYDYASVGIGSNKNPQLPELDIPQHTLLLHSSGNSDTGGSHTYSKPTTPLTNYDVTTNNFMAHSPGNHSQARDYSKLNSSGDHAFSHSQCSDMDESQYSHIDEAHQYSKLSESNSKGYSQLSLGELQASPGLTEHHELAQPYENPLSATSAHDSVKHQVQDTAAPQPYECPISPAERQDKDRGAEENHTYTTLEVDPGDTGYSKLHIFEGSQNSASKL